MASDDTLDAVYEHYDGNFGRGQTPFLVKLHKMLGDVAIPACGWNEDGVTFWFDWQSMGAYANEYFGRSGQWFMVYSW